MMRALCLAGLGLGCAFVVWVAWGLIELQKYFDTYEGGQDSDRQ